MLDPLLVLVWQPLVVSIFDGQCHAIGLPYLAPETGSLSRATASVAAGILGAAGVAADRLADWPADIFTTLRED